MRNLTNSSSMTAPSKQEITMVSPPLHKAKQINVTRKAHNPSCCIENESKSYIIFITKGL